MGFRCKFSQQNQSSESKDGNFITVVTLQAMSDDFIIAQRGP
jgi:hypothetical protein